LLIWDPAELHRSPETFPYLESLSLFQRNVPLSLEIGCGTGEFLCELARRNPDEVFLGLDNAYKPVIRAGVQASELGLDNVKFLRADIRLGLTRTVAKSFQQVYLQFPVPGPAGKGRRPRFFDEKFVHKIQRILNDGGILSVLTDSESGFLEMKRLVAEDPGFQFLREEEYHLELDSDLSSHNFQVWIGRGHRPHRFEVKKIPWKPR
jgi:tRNA (guanine-N7-)-methyltransferase